MASDRTMVEKLLAEADIKINGTRPWDLQVYDERVFARVLAGGTLAIGESYMDGWWDAPALDQFFAKALSIRLDKHLKLSLSTVALILKSWIFNMQSPSKASEVAELHYDLGNDVYEKMLDPRLIYTCGYWSGTPAAKNLLEAQEAKLDLICRKLGLNKGDKVLDIGCGFGGFAKYAAEKYGAHVVGITLSKEQIVRGEELCKGLPVEFRLQDYRELDEKFDHVVSVGMYEHVGYKNGREYMRSAARCLKEGGLFLFHTIGTNETSTIADPWFHKYIFPNGAPPSMRQVSDASEKIFVMEDWHSFGADYDPTLMAWWENFDAAWPELKDKYGERFYRMWKYYLLSMAGAFRSRMNNQLWQIVFSKGGIPGGYKTVR